MPRRGGVEFAVGLQDQLTAARSAEEVSKILAAQQAKFKFQIKKANKAASQTESGGLLDLPAPR